ncbi:DUF2905 domain-containing protein [Candidatus Aerophobetes bacterium]|nr:DUF2905 domain-containing protein [Candidatus Aerophobetes bacterium]
MSGLIGKLLIGIGVMFIILGIVFLFGNKIPLLGRLPGDIYIRRGHFSFYFPLSTCLIISLILTLIFSIFWGRK